MDAITIGILGIIVFLFLIFMGMNIGLALLMVGFVGYAAIVNPKAAIAALRLICVRVPEKLNFWHDAPFASATAI